MDGLRPKRLGGDASPYPPADPSLPWRSKPSEIPLFAKSAIIGQEISQAAMLPPVLTITPEMLRLIGSFVVVFLAVHPFQDGNGRLSRVLTSLMLLRAGYAHVPYSSLERVIEATKEGYYRALRRTQSTLGSGHPDWEAWLLFFLRSLVRQKDVLATKIDLDDTRTDDLHPLAKKILALLPDHEILTLGQVVTLTGGRPSTVKLRLKELVEKGYLVPKGRGRGAHYVRGLPNVRGSCYLSKHHPSHE